MPRQVIRPDKYRCPTCGRWYGEHMTTRLLARHRSGDDPLKLCDGSYHPLGGLLHQVGGTPASPLEDAGQQPLFPASDLHHHP